MNKVTDALLLYSGINSFNAFTIDALVFLITLHFAEL
jgi:hypothetical protein